MNLELNGSAGLDGFVSDEVKSRIALKRGMSVASLADALQIRRATLSARVNGHVPFSPSLLGDIAARLGTTASEIVAAAERRRAATAGVGTSNPGTVTSEEEVA